MSEVDSASSNEIVSESSESSATPVDDSSDYREIKIDGESVRVPISELEQAYGLEKTSYKRFEEASKLRKEVDGFIKNLQEGDLDLLTELVSEDKLYDYAENLLKRKVEWDETPEETRARIKAEHERDMYKQELEEYSKREQQEILAAVSDQAIDEIDEEISAVIEHMSKDHGNIVNTPEFIQDVARMMLAQLDQGAAKMNSRKAAEQAWKGWRNRVGSYVKNISHNDLAKYLTKEQLAALRKADLDNAMSQFPVYGGKSDDNIAPRKRKETINVNDFFDTLDQKLGMR